MVSIIFFLAAPLLATEDPFNYDEESAVEEIDYANEPTVLGIEELDTLPEETVNTRKQNLIRMGRSKGFFNCAIPIQIFDRRGNMVKVIHRRAFDGGGLKPGRYVASCRDEAEIQFGLLK